MLERIEFYTCPDGSINVKESGKPLYPYEQDCRQLTEELIVLIRDLYPGAFSALSKLYEASERNRSLYEYRIVHRFIRCNFGEYDSLTFDVGNAGTFNFEEIRCPLRGECVFEGAICKPRLRTALTERELEVARLLSEGLGRAEVAEELGISAYTVNRHIAKIKARMHFRHTSQIVARFSQNSPDRDKSNDNV